MKEMETEIPLPLDFYDAEGWQESIVDFYCANQQFPGKEILNAPVAMLTKSIGNAIDIYGDFPDKVINLFNQLISPLFFGDDYEKNVYLPIKKAAISESNPPLADLAGSLYNIRKIFDKNKNFLLNNFQAQIDQVNQPNDAEKFTYFADRVQKITKVHVHQIVDIIKQSA
jgi:hypothetical protein